MNGGEAAADPDYAALERWERIYTYKYTSAKAIAGWTNTKEFWANAKRHYLNNREELQRENCTVEWFVRTLVKRAAEDETFLRDRQYDFGFFEYDKPYAVRLREKRHGTRQLVSPRPAGRRAVCAILHIPANPRPPSACSTAERRRR